MNPARKTQSVSDSNPRSVLRAISASGQDLSEASFEPGLSLEPILMIDEPASAPATVELIPLRINPDTSPHEHPQSENALDAPLESAQQIQQLAIRLKQNEQELIQRESELEAGIAELDRAAIKQQSEYEHQQNQLGQQASQVRCQQLHLMQLQTDIVKSYEATRLAIEALVEPVGSDANTVATLKALKYELSGRFDYIARRWEHLAELMQNTRHQNVAQKSLDDSVDWTGDLS